MHYNFRGSDILSKEWDHKEKFRNQVREANANFLDSEMTMEFLPRSSIVLESYEQLCALLSRHNNWEIVTVNDFCPFFAKRHEFNEVKVSYPTLKFVHKKNVNSAAVVYLVKVPDDCATEEEMKYSGEYISKAERATEEEMALLFRHILTIDPTMTMEDTTKDSWNRHPALTDWLAKHTESTQYTY